MTNSHVSFVYRIWPMFDTGECHLHTDQSWNSCDSLDGYPFLLYGGIASLLWIVDYIYTPNCVFSCLIWPFNLYIWFSSWLSCSVNFSGFLWPECLFQLTIEYTGISRIVTLHPGCSFIKSIIFCIYSRIVSMDVSDSGDLIAMYFLSFWVRSHVTSQT